MCRVKLGNYRLDLQPVDGFLLMCRLDGHMTNDDLLAVQRQVALSHPRYRCRVWDLRDVSFAEADAGLEVGSQVYEESRERHVVVVGSSPEVVELARVHARVWPGRTFELMFDVGDAVDRLRAVHRQQLAA